MKKYLMSLVVFACSLAKAGEPEFKKLYEYNFNYSSANAGYASRLCPYFLDIEINGDEMKLVKTDRSFKRYFDQYTDSVSTVTYKTGKTIENDFKTKVELAKYGKDFYHVSIWFKNKKKHQKWREEYSIMEDMVMRTVIPKSGWSATCTYFPKK